MNVNRRQFLRGLGAVGVLVIGGTVYRGVDQGVFAAGRGPAYAEWADWHAEPAAGALRLVQSAILAANPHNTQPWFFQVSDHRIELFADTSRHLGTMDPYLREMHIGLGCAIENMMLTATAVGYGVDLTLEAGQLTPPAAEPQLEKVATLTLSPAQPQPDPLHEAIPLRHTNRYNYAAERSVEPALLAQLPAVAASAIGETLGAESQVKLFTYQQGSPPFQTMADATIAATETIIADHEMAHDSYRWADQSWQEVQREKDGPYIDTAGVPAHVRALVKMLPATPQQQFDAGWLSNTRATMQNTDVLGLIAVPDLYDRVGALQAGRVWQRLHLWATTQSLAMQPINQLPEVVDRDRQLRQDSEIARIMDGLTGEPAWRPTFAFRLGHPINEVLPSARRPLEEVMG